MMELIIQLISFDVMLLFEKVNLDVTIESLQIMSKANQYCKARLFLNHYNFIYVLITALGFWFI